MVWKIPFTTLSDLPCMLLFLIWTCIYCLMGATPMKQITLHVQTKKLEIMLSIDLKQGLWVCFNSSAGWVRPNQLVYEYSI